MVIMTRRIRALFLLSLLSTPFLASQALAAANLYDGYWTLSAGAGRSFYRMDTDNYIVASEPLPPDHYYKNDIHDGSFVNITGGYTWARYADAFPAFMLVLNYTYAFQGKVSGYINQYNLGAFQNYSYSYDFSRQSLMAVIKANIFSANCFMPYIIAGTGVSFNKASSYREQPLSNVTPRISPGYDTGHHSSWAYIVGAGVDYAFRDDIWVGLEYNYGDFGTVDTGSGAGTPTVTGVNYSDQHLTNSLRANSVLINFTYLLNYL